MICFCVPGLPFYQARAIGAFTRSTDEKVAVLAFGVCASGGEIASQFGYALHLVKPTDRLDLKVLLGEMPRVLVIPGFRLSVFMKAGADVRAAGGKVIVAIDDNFVLSFKGVVKMCLFRLLGYARRFDGFWVPRKSGRKLMRFYGVPREKIHTGLYSIDGSVFYNGEPLPRRPKRILFVGQFYGRKNILRLCRAFLSVDATIRADWKLEMCGRGELRDAIPRDEAIVVHDYVPPLELAKLYRAARGFIIPSKEDHWPLVVHEASLSGCVLLLSDRVGNKVDFLEEGVNGYSFPPYSRRRMAEALTMFMQMDDERLLAAQGKSLELSGQVTLDTFIAAVGGFSQA